MKAKVGDHLVVKGHQVGERERHGEVLEVGDKGDPPFRIRWVDDGHESTIYPGPDVIIEHHQAKH
jgi:hypothetical protein